MTAQEAFTVQCPSCSSGFLIDPSKVPVAGIHARCRSCSHVFLVERPGAEEPFEAPPAEAPAVQAPEPADTGHEAFSDTVTAPAAPEATHPAEAAVEATAEAAPAQTPAAPEATHPAEAAVEATAEAAPAQTPAAPETTAPESPTAPPQFERQDPHDKASRLARVLVSDMISYNPDRYANALEQDSLKQDFEDEVQKSWGEYVDQVGQELADSSSYFQDALNEILARGKKVF